MDHSHYLTYSPTHAILHKNRNTDKPYKKINLPCASYLFYRKFLIRPTVAGGFVTWNTLKRFAKQNEQVLFCLYHHPSELEHLKTVKEVCEECTAFPANGKWAATPMIKSFFSRRPYKAHRFFNPAMKEYIHRLLQRKPFDIIHCQNFYTAAYINGNEPCLRIHYKENVEGNILLRYARSSNNPLIKIAASLEGLRTRAYETNACRKFDQVLSISPLDSDTLQALDTSLPILHQRPGVDLDEYQYLDEPAGPPTILFTGTMSYYPNIDGVQEYLLKVWPMIRQAVPNAECYIAGNNPPASIKNYDGKEGLHVTGRVPRVQDYLEKAWVYTVPLRIGGGIRLKILEAMAAGRAIVSTSVGCEGLDGQNDVHLLIEDDPGKFASAIIELLQNTGKRNTLRSNARQLVESVYDWDKVIRLQQEMYCSLLLRKPNQSPPS